jgi:bifunctional UDP-N-acetylglucosamine pyrophosphorylase/glucosamine-1-phosphate N-acetyltransferase
MTDKKLTIVVLAAGLGTRMRSRKAKVLHEAGGLPLIEHVVRSAVSIAPPDRVVVVTGHQAEQVEQAVSAHGIRFARQTEQLGTGHAVSVCADVVPDKAGRVVVVYGDGPLLSPMTLQRLLAHHDDSGAAATVITTELADPTGYGRAIVDEAGDVRAIVEQKVASPDQARIRTINSGIYCFDAPTLWRFLPSVQPNPVSKEYYLTDIVEILNAAGRRVSSLLHEDPTELMGINSRVELAEVDAVFRARKARDLMLSGVTIIRPESVLLDADVSVGAETVIEPSAQILGRSKVGEGCRIGAGAIIRDSTIGDRVEIGPYTIVNTTVIECDASVGPFARLRMENHVESGAHIGNFVELKKTRFGAGAKAGHLAYLGDSEIGTEVNIGAGTITCNFDGAKKHRTRVGDNAFIGSNSTLVAPVDVGTGAYTAAGSVITDAVPADALGIGRGRQVNKEGWAARRRATHK